MKILAIDTSTKYLSLAITDNDKTEAAFHERQDIKHSSLLIPTIDKLLKKCGLKLRNINAIALSIGPGSFTGLRIAVATCKGINLALGIPIATIPTLDVITYNFISEHKAERRLCPLIDAKKGKLYACFYERTSPKPGIEAVKPPPFRVWGKLERITDYMLVDIDTLLKKIDKPVLVFGDGVMLYGEAIEKNRFVRVSTKDWYPKADVVARLGFAKAEKRQFANPDKLVPMYLHSQYCQVRGG